MAFTALHKLILIRLLIISVTLLHKVTLHHRAQVAVRTPVAWARTARTATCALVLFGHVHRAFHFGMRRSLRWVVSQVLNHGRSNRTHSLWSTPTIHGTLRLSYGLSSWLQSFLVHVKRLKAFNTSCASGAACFTTQMIIFFTNGLIISSLRLNLVDLSLF